MFYFLILTAALSRLIPHPPNLVCIGALGLFAGCYLRGRIAWAIPICAMLLSDSLGHLFGLRGVGFYNPISMLLVYGAFGVTALIGRNLAQNRTPARIGAAAILSSLVFFLMSNFGVWLTGQYTTTFAGLVDCYVMAIPFYGNTLAGDLLYSTLLFGTYEWLCVRPRTVASHSNQLALARQRAR